MEKKQLHEIIRVNQAGEYGAIRIYKGQLTVFKGDKTIQKMADQEADHLKKFNQLMIENKVRPTVFQPIWHVGGYLLGMTTALFGRKTAHACTIAVESVIDGHYQQQLEELQDKAGCDHLKQVIEECHLDELEHRDTAIQEGGKDIPGFDFLSGAVQAVSKLAIWLSKKI